MSQALADRYLPVFQFAEHHQLAIRGNAGQALDALSTMSPDDDPLIRALLALREAPARLAALLGRKNALKGRGTFGLHEFTLLERDGDQALLYGLVGRFWRADFGLQPISDGAAFRQYASPGVAKLLLIFHCQVNADGGLQVHTQTRVYCPDHLSRLLFTPYWLAIRPASGLIRRRLLATIQHRLDADTTHPR